jgi:hypothetical protein
LGRYNRPTLLTEAQIGQSLFTFRNGGLTSSLACNSEGRAWVLGFDRFGQSTVWQAMVGNPPQVLLARGSFIPIGRNTAVFESASRLVVQGDSLIVISSFSGKTEAIQLTSSGYRLLAQYGSAEALDACTTTRSVYTLLSEDLVRGTLRQDVAIAFGSGHQIIGAIPDVSSPELYSLGCGVGRSGLIFRQNGGLSLLKNDEATGMSYQVLGNVLDGVPVSDVWDLNFAQDGTPFFGMMAAPNGIEEGAAFAVSTNGQTSMVLFPGDPLSIGLIRLGNDIYWYQGGGHGGTQ